MFRNYVNEHKNKSQLATGRTKIKFGEKVPVRNFSDAEIAGIKDWITKGYLVEHKEVEVVEEVTVVVVDHEVVEEVTVIVAEPEVKVEVEVVVPEVEVEVIEEAPVEDTKPSYTKRTSRKKVVEEV